MPMKWVRMTGSELYECIATSIDTGFSTKHVVRFHTPEISHLLHEREQHKETLQVEADKAYKSFLQYIAQHYASFRNAVNKLATADCLLSLATVSLHGDVCKPSFVDHLSLSIVDGRHPIIEQVRSDPYIPNSISLGGAAPRHLVISGPNVSVHFILSSQLVSRYLDGWEIIRSETCGPISAHGADRILRSSQGYESKYT